MHDIEATLADAISALRSLNYDDLRDLNDCIQFVMTGHAPRQGRPPSVDTLFLNLYNSSRHFSSLANAFHAMIALPNLPNSDRDLQALAQMVDTLLDALRPQEKRRDGRGYITIRYIPRLKYNRQTEHWEVKTYGPYGYLRRWATGGGHDRKRQILKSYYLGKEIALLYLAGKLKAAVIIEAYETGKIQTLQKNARKHVGRISKKERLMHEPPTIEFDPSPQFMNLIRSGQLKLNDIARIYSTAILEGLVRGWVNHTDIYEHYSAGTLDMLKAALTQRLDAEAKEQPISS